MVRLSDDSRVGIGLDVTDRKRYEAEMQGARTSAEAANRAKDEFIAMLGHELRNPLSAISGAVAVLQRVGSPGEPATSARDVITRQTQHLARLMDDLLDVGRVMTGKIVLEQRAIDLLDAAERVVTTIRATGRAGRHRLTVAGTPAWVDGDITRIEQVITNLVTNALKYTPADGKISVVVGEDARESILRVADTGHGIAPQLLPRIFDLFVQGEQAPERAQGGLGIGLTLVRRLVELHGGQVEAASAGAGQGSRFTIRLPRLTSSAPEPAADSPAEMAVPPAGPGRRILVVDDQADSTDSLALFLRLRGHDVRTAHDGPTALQAIERYRPEVVFLDLGLPGMSGYDVARRARMRTDLDAMRLVALTGYGTDGDRQKARDAGFDVHLAKPVDPRSLDDLLASLH
jgi:CheY-like chemotaxis protein